MYTFGPNKRPMYIREKNNGVLMVRVGGGWQNLKDYLQRQFAVEEWRKETIQKRNTAAQKLLEMKSSPNILSIIQPNGKRKVLGRAGSGMLKGLAKSYDLPIDKTNLRRSKTERTVSRNVNKNGHQMPRSKTQRHETRNRGKSNGKRNKTKLHFEKGKTLHEMRSSKVLTYR
eukprot:UN03167